MLRDILYEPGNYYIIIQHVIYEVYRKKDLKMRAKKGFNGKIMCFFSVFSAYSTHFNILKSGPNQKYNFFMDNFNLDGPKWVGIIEQIKQF